MWCIPTRTLHSSTRPLLLRSNITKRHLAHKWMNIIRKTTERRALPAALTGTPREPICRTRHSTQYPLYLHRTLSWLRRSENRRGLDLKRAKARKRPRLFSQYIKTIGIQPSPSFFSTLPVLLRLGSLAHFEPDSYGSLTLTDWHSSRRITLMGSSHIRSQTVSWPVRRRFFCQTCITGTCANVGASVQRYVKPAQRSYCSFVIRFVAHRAR